jgi:hypothetical protein
MGIDGSWRRINAAELDSVPDSPGVFELANLVRNVVMIGADRGSGLRTTLHNVLRDERLRTLARYVRFELSNDAAGVAARMLSEYRAAHRGSLPPAQPPGAIPPAPVSPTNSEPRLRTIRRDAPADPAATPTGPSFIRRHYA